VIPLERHEECTWKDDEGLKEVLKTKMKIWIGPLKIQRKGMKTL